MIDDLTFTSDDGTLKIQVTYDSIHIEAPGIVIDQFIQDGVVGRLTKNDKTCVLQIG